MKFAKKLLAGVLSAAMAITALPAASTDALAAETGVEPVLFYDMSHDGSTLLDVSGNGHNAAMVGFADTDYTGTEGNYEISFDGSDNYVQIPASVKEKLTDEKFTITATFKNSVKSNAWLFTLGTTVSTWPNVTNYLFVAPNSSDGNYNASILGAIKDGSTEHRCPTDILLTPDKERYNTVAVVYDNGNVTYYLNGVANTVTESGVSVAAMLEANSTSDCIGYIGKSLYQPDPFFTGTMTEFKIYDDALSTDVVKSATLKAYIQDNPDVDFGLESAILGDNESLDMVTQDLNFPAEVNGIALTWESSDTTVVGNDGKVTPAAESKTVTITVTGAYAGETIMTEEFSVTVVNPSSADYDLLDIPNKDNIRGNITLPTVGAYGAPITWKSSNEAVISTAVVENEGYDSTPAGVVTRQAEDTKVTLTATVGEGAAAKAKAFEVTVKAKADAVGENDLTDYVMAYFVGDGAGQEKIYLATSRDGLNFEEINDAQVFIESTMGEEGLRDPYIFRSAEGDKFYMIATDLCIGAGKGWGAAQTAGSQAIMVWESEDLVNWSNQRMVTVSEQIEAGCTWAPEVYYDDITGEYIVFWASKVKADNYSKQRLYYAKTRDFYTFTEPKAWIDMEGISTIVLQRMRMVIRSVSSWKIRFHVRRMDFC